MAALDSVVALVTGASRGAGRGIALELGAAGAVLGAAAPSVGRHVHRRRPCAPDGKPTGGTPDAAPTPRPHREHDGESRRASLPAQYLLRRVKERRRSPDLGDGAGTAGPRH